MSISVAVLTLVAAVLQRIRPADVPRDQARVLPGVHPANWPVRDRVAGQGAPAKSQSPIPAGLLLPAKP